MGGAANVFLARDHKLDPPRITALKVLLPELTDDPEALAMFFSEARIAARLNHPNIVEINGFGRTEGIYCLAMEFVFGASLGAVLAQSARSGRPLTVGALLTIIANVLDALEYAHTLDPFISLSFAAAATKNLKLGTGISLIPQRDHIVTAKVVASLDMMSNGRFTLGIGGGWNVEEMENHGATYKTRFKLMRERVLAMKALWTEEEAEFDGEMVKLEKSWSWPKPLQKPHPPIILGGETKYTLQRVAEFCDGWLPRVTPDFDPSENMARLRQAAEEAGRDPKELSVTLFRAPAEPQQLEACAQAGIDGGLFQLPSADRETILPLLDEYAGLIT